MSPWPLRILLSLLLFGVLLMSAEPLHDRFRSGAHASGFLAFAMCSALLFLSGGLVKATYVVLVVIAGLESCAIGSCTRSIGPVSMLLSGVSFLIDRYQRRFYPFMFEPPFSVESAALPPDAVGFVEFIESL